MEIYTFKIKINGEIFARTEWGNNRRDALKTLWGIYGRENLEVMA